MQYKHARHPYLEEVSVLVAEEDITIEEIVSDDDEHPVVERAVDRIRETIEDGVVDERITEDSGGLSGERIDVLSYPVARIIVSAVGDRRLVERYAEAEAERSINIVQKHRDEPPFRGEYIEVGDLFDEFGFAPIERSDEVYPDGYDVHVTDYLQYRPEHDRSWSIRARQVNDGRVPLAEEEIDALLRNAIVERVGSDLPLDVPDSIADALSEEVREIRRLLHERVIPTNDTAVVPELFPPCIHRLYESVQDGKELDESERMAIVTFLSAAGLDAEEIVAHYPRAGDNGLLERQIRRVAETNVPPPGYGALVELGVCDSDERPEDADHPLTAYRQQVEEADVDASTDGIGDPSKAAP